MTDASVSDSKRELIRHTLATLAYRGSKATGKAPAGFADFRCCDGARTPGQILAHLGDLMDWALSMVEGKQRWQNSDPLPWDKERERFFTSLQNLDNFLASDSPLQIPAEKLFQGPIADALSHVGQIAMLRRMAGGPLKGESYFAAEMKIGRVGSEQAAPKHEFD
jgi:hypothetical protein